jgi:hypothetical protein
VEGLLLLLGVLRVLRVLHLALRRLRGVGREVVGGGGGAGAAVGVGWGEGGVGRWTAGRGVRVEVWHRFALDRVVVCWLGHHGVCVRRSRERDREREKVRVRMTLCLCVSVDMFVVEVDCRDCIFVGGVFRGFFSRDVWGRMIPF